MFHRQNRRALTGLLLVAILIGAVVLTGTAQAARDRQIGQQRLEVFGPPVTGSLDATTPQTILFFDGKQNNVLSLHALTTSGDLMVDLAVFDPAGQPVAYSVAAGQNPNVSVVEAFVTPADGMYTLTVVRSGNTSGTYELRLLGGYAKLEAYDTFEGPPDPLKFTWTPWSSESTGSSLENGALRIDVWVDDMLSFTAPDELPIYTDLFIQADFRIDGNPTYYEYGFLFRLASDNNLFYSLTFSSDGDWSLYFYNGEWQVVQDWVVAPAIDGTAKQVTVGAFIQGSTFRAYFNGALVGEVTDTNNYRADGTISLVGATAREQTGTLTIFADNLAVTTPLTAVATVPSLAGAVVEPVDTPTGPDTQPTSQGLPFGLGGATKVPTTAAVAPTATPVPPPTAVPLPTATPIPPPTPIPLPTLTPIPPPTVTPQTTAGQEIVNWRSDAPSDVLNELQGYGLIPTTGSMALTVPSSFGDTSNAGFNYYPLGQGKTFRNFVLSFDAYLVQTGPENGCGMMFRELSDSYSVALVTEDQAALLVQFNGGEPHPSSFYDYHSAVAAGRDVGNRVVVIAWEETVVMYVNGVLVAGGDFVARSGHVALEVFIVEDDFGATQRTNCELENIWLWEW
ncbi:MAG: hypothetical protein JXJ20_14200 [Anaerolineae bacterium]|nr:hypothetical protein [Anaerolineae bacterium]